MAATVESFDSFRTPNLFEASIAADGGHIDSYFPDKMDVGRSDCFDPDSWTLFPQAQDPADCSDAFAMSANDFTCQSIATPPPSAKEPPANWAFNVGKQTPHSFHNPLHQIDTSHPAGSARFDWGQPTPPDDQGSPSSQFPAEADELIKQEPDVQQSKPSTSTRRKKSDEQAETQNKRRRSRKSVSIGGGGSSSSSSNTDTNPSADPVEEERRNRFLERNRVAASKCRQKKKEWTQNLEGHARDLHSNNHQLQVLVNSLKDEVMYLRGEMLKHGDCDCTGIREYLSREADFLASGSPRTPGSRHGGLLSGHASALGSPRHSIASTLDSHDNLDPALKRGGSMASVDENLET